MPAHPLHKQLIATPDYADAVRWAEENEESVSEGYSFSKEAVIVWTMSRAPALIKQRGIRINCVMPALTQTPMLTDQIAVKSDPAMLKAVVEPMGRPANPEEQAFPLVMINSPAASFVNGVALNVDGGRLAQLTIDASESAESVASTFAIRRARVSGFFALSIASACSRRAV